MTEQIENCEWLEGTDGTRVAIDRTCSFGRSASNHLVLADESMCRRHAIIHAQGENEFWLVDLGSSNGTYLAGRRVNQPMHLRDREQIQITRVGGPGLQRNVLITNAASKPLGSF